MVSAGILSMTVGGVDSGISASQSTKKSENNDFAKIFDGQAVNNSKNDNAENISNKSKEVQNNIKKYYIEKPKTEEVSDEEISEQMAEMAVDIYNKVIDVIAKNLQCETEEVEQAMDNLGISADGLLDKQNINKIVCEISGTEDTMNILTDTSLSEAVQEVYSKISEIVSDFEETTGLSQKGLTDLLESFETKKLVVDNEMVDVNVTEENVEMVTEDAVENVKIEDDVPSETNEELETVENNQNSLKDTTNKTSLENQNNSNSGNEKSENKDMTNEYANVVGNIKEAIVANISSEDISVADKIIKQITDDIKLYAKADTTSLEIQLEPESLGKVSLTVASKAGAVTAQLTVQNEIAREAIESQMSTLKESLNNQGIKIEAIEVTIASKEFEQNLDKEGNSSEKEGSKHRRHLSDEELLEINGTKSSEEISIDNMMKEMGNTVSYSA